MSATPEKKSPPYPSARSFDNYTDHLREHPPLPSRIDKGVMSHLNYGTQQAILGAFRHFKFVTDDDVPTKRLEAFLAAKGAERQTLIQTILKEAYPYLWNDKINLERVSPHEFEEKFKSETGVTGSTAVKAISFFLALAEQAGIKLSPHLTSRKPRAANPTATKRTPRQKRATKKQEEARREEPPELDNAGSMSKQLLEKFPTFDPAWPDPIKEKWFAGFERLMKSAEGK